MKRSLCRVKRYWPVDVESFERGFDVAESALVILRPPSDDGIRQEGPKSIGSLGVEPLDERRDEHLALGQESE